MPNADYDTWHSAIDAELKRRNLHPLEAFVLYDFEAAYREGITPVAAVADYASHYPPLLRQ